MSIPYDREQLKNMSQAKLEDEISASCNDGNAVKLAMFILQEKKLTLNTGGA